MQLLICQENLAFITMFWKATRKQSVVKLTIITLSYISLVNEILKEIISFQNLIQQAN